MVYLGSVIARRGGIDQDVIARISKAKQNFGILKNIWQSSRISMKNTMTSFNSNVTYVLQLDCEARIAALTMRGDGDGEGLIVFEIHA